MKKIIGAVAMTALALSVAGATTKVNLNYRNGAYLYTRTDNGEKDENNEVATTYGDLSEYQGGQDTMTLSASGDHLTFKAGIQPKVSNALRFNVLSLLGKWNGFEAEAGWNGDGINGGYRVNKDASNWEGLFFETYKLGSLFGKSSSKYSDNAIGFGGAGPEDREMFLRGAYTLKADDLTVKVQGAVISDRAWKKSNTDTEYMDGNKAWSAVVDVKQKGLVGGEIVVKGRAFDEGKQPTIYKGKAADHKDAAQALVIGAYVSPLMVKDLTATVGGAVSMYDGDVTDYSIDLRARYVVTKPLSLTYYLKYAALTEDVDSTTAGVTTAEIDKNVGYGKNKFSSSAVLWNFLNARYVVNDLATASLAFGALTDLDNKKESNNGTTLSIVPAVELFAAKNASVTVGAAFAFGGIGAEKKSSFGEEMDFNIAVPVLFRVKM